MTDSLRDGRLLGHLRSSEMRAQMAKADLRKAEIWRAAIGQALARAVALGGWSLKEFAAAVGRDERQVARWIDGTERPQLDTLFAVESVRQLLIVALAEAAGAGVEVETIVRVIRRSA